MKELAATLFARLLGHTAEWVLRNRKTIFLFHIALFAVCIFYTVKHLEFSTNRDDLVGSNKKYHQNFLQFKKEFPIQDDLVVVVESEDAEKNRQFVERLGPKLEADRVTVEINGKAVQTNIFQDVIFRTDLRMLGQKALLFVPEKDLEGLKKALGDYKPFIQQFTRATNFDSLFSLINTQFRTAKREQNEQTESLIKALPALERIVVQTTMSLRRAGVPPSPGVSALFGASVEDEQQEYITFAHGRIYLVTAHAPGESLNGEAVERLRELVGQTREEIPGVNVGITGGPVLEHDEMKQSQRDTTTASIVSLLLSALIFIYGYNETGRPVKATVCLVVGLGFTMGYTTLVIGHLNILTITFVPMLIGLAIDFGVHLITRYEEELRHGKSEADALKKAMVFTGQGIVTGALTTAGAFFAMGLTSFKGIQEMGIIAGGGLIICLVPMMTMLPVMLLRGRQNVIDHQAGDPFERRARIENLWLQRPVLVSVITVALCALALTQVHKLFFDYDLRNMQSAGLPAVEFEKKLINSAASTASVPGSNSPPKSVLFGVVIADSAEEAVALQDKIEKLDSVASVESMARRLTEDQTGKLALISEIKQEIAGIQFQEMDVAPVNIPELSQTLWSFGGYLGAAAEDAGEQEKDLVKQLHSLHGAVLELRKEMLAGKPEAVSSKLLAMQTALFRDIRETFSTLKNQDDRAPLRVADLPPALRDRFIGVTGKYLLQVYPKEDIWKRENQKEFIRELRKALDPKETNHPIITGTPVQLYQYTSLLKKSYEQAAWYSLGAIAILVLIHFRNVWSVLLALLPVAVGTIWLVGLMGAFGIPFNPANIMTLPLVIGIGVTNGIHILNRFAEERTPSILAKSTGKAVFVSGLTSIAGFGSLILAKHQGIRSLGEVMSVGITACMVAGLTTLPAILSLWIKLRGKRQSNPVPTMH